MIKKNIKYIVGIDEVGRGPLAGPVAVCAFKVPVDFVFRGFGKIKDSKKLLPKNREKIFMKLEVLRKKGIIDFFCCYESAKNIDKLGLTKTIKNCMDKAIKKLKLVPDECQVLLDGGLKAPEIFKNQKTIIKGDEKERAIAFASIIAKVSRDELMCKLSKKYPRYAFHIHKGYGTKKHRESIIKDGLCPFHRRSFCKNIFSKIV